MAKNKKKKKPNKKVAARRGKKKPSPKPQKKPALPIQSAAEPKEPIEDEERLSPEQGGAFGEVASGPKEPIEGEERSSSEEERALLLEEERAEVQNSWWDLREESERRRREHHEEQATAYFDAFARLMPRESQDRLLALVKKLEDLTKGVDPSDPASTVFLGSEREKARAIAEKLNDLGGMVALQFAHHIISLNHRTWARELSFVFDGVGDWMD